jgi:putative transposase
MFKAEEFDLWCLNNGITEHAKNYLQMIRSSEPSRLVRSGPRNICGRFPSIKMSRIIQFESHKNELPRVREKERCKKTIEYYDQTEPIRLNMEGSDGRNQAFMRTPDMFCIEDDGAGWEEYKTEEELLKLEAKNPNYYRRDEDGNWHCPPGEQFALQFGFFFRVKSSKDINWIFQRWMEFLEDYYRADTSAISTEAREVVLQKITSQPGLSLESLCTLSKDTASRDDIFMMIAYEVIFVDLYAVAPSELEFVKVYADEITASAYSNVIEVPSSSNVHAPSYVDIEHGSRFSWNDNIWTVVNKGDALVGILAEDKSFTELPLTIIEELVKAGRINGLKRELIPSTHPEVQRRLAEAKKEDLAEANRKVEIVRASLRGETLPEDVSSRTLRRWKEAYRIAKQSYGCGYIGLLPKPNKGNQNPRIDQASKDFLDDFIDKNYETLKRRKKHSSYALYLAEFKKEEVKRKGISAVSYKTFCRAIKRRPKYQQTLKMRGHRAAYKDKEFYMELEFTTPKHGERPFHIGHIDHTKGDAEFICARTRMNLGRPWVTRLTDAYCRRILATIMLFDPPSYRSCMLVVRECVRRFGRIPQIVIVDGGIEFSSKYFEALLAWYECTKKERTGKPNFGSTDERLFGTTNTQFWHNLEGNTQNTKDVRQLTKAINPKNHALWTLEAGDQTLREWSYETYDLTVHPALEGQSPREAYNYGMERYGERKHRIIPYDEHFRMMTLPTTAKGTAKVQSNGVKINNRYFWTDDFKYPDVMGTTPPVRYDPWNAGVAYAYVLGKWAFCRSEKYSIFHGRSEREIMLASTILCQKNKLHNQNQSITTAKLATFLQSIEAQEVLLRQQLADLAGRNAWEALQTYSGNPRTEVSADGVHPALPAQDKVPPSEAISENTRQNLDLQTYGDF